MAPKYIAKWLRKAVTPVKSDIPELQIASAEVVHAPAFTPQIKVKMKITVSHEHNGGPTHEVGEEYFLDAPLADSYILRGYADGELSRDYTTPQVEAIRFGHQTLVPGQEA